MTDAVVDLKVRFPLNDAELSKLHHRAFASVEGADRATVDPWSVRLERHSLTWVGAFSADKLVGFVHAVWDGGTHAFVLDTAVDPEFRRRGLGRRLVNTVVEEAFAAGCSWIHVDYEPELADFYEHSCGFRPTAAGLRSVRERPGRPDLTG